MLENLEILPGIFTSNRVGCDFTLTPNDEKLSHAVGGNLSAVPVWPLRVEGFLLLRSILDPNLDLTPGHDPATSHTARAALIAAAVHALQVDKLGYPYIEHPRRVYLNTENGMDPNEFTDEEREIALQAAWLHDVLEDSEESFYRRVTPSDLLAWGISPSVVDVVILLTRTDDPSIDYYPKVGNHRLARCVKLADIADNTADWRVNQLDDVKREKLTRKYEAAKEALEYGSQEYDFDFFRETHNPPQLVSPFALPESFEAHRNLQRHQKPLLSSVVRTSRLSGSDREVEKWAWKSTRWAEQPGWIDEGDDPENQYESLVHLCFATYVGLLTKGAKFLESFLRAQDYLDDVVSQTGGIANPGSMTRNQLTSAEVKLHVHRALANLKILKARHEVAKLLSTSHSNVEELVFGVFTDEEIIELWTPAWNAAPHIVKQIQMETTRRGILN